MPKFLDQVIPHAGPFEQERHLIQHIAGGHRDDGLLFHIAEQGDLVAQLLIDGIVGAGDDHVGRDTDRAQGGDRVLGGLGLDLAGRADVGQPGHVDEKHILAPDLVAQLAQRFQEWLGLDVAHRPADLHDDHIRLGLLANPGHAALDLVGDVRDHLDGPAQEIAAALLADDLGIHLSAGEVAEAAEADVDETFVVTQVQVGFGAVIQHVDFSMLVGTHRPGIHIDVRVQFLDGHLEARVP